MNALNMLRAHQHEAEYDAAVWIDNQPALRPIAAFLAHHRTARALAAAAIGTALAPVSAVATAITAARLVNHAHAIAGEGSAPCQPCVTAEADEFAADDNALTLADMADVWDLKDGGLL